VKKVAQYVDSYINDTTGLVYYLKGGRGPYEYGIIDWPAQMRYGYDMETASRTVVDAYAYIDFYIISKIAAETGNNEDAVVFANKAEKMKNAINNNLINAEGIYIDGLNAGHEQSEHVSQHANAYPLAMGMVPAENQEQVINVVKEKKMNVGMVSLRWLPQAIGEAGEGEHLFELYTNTEWDGWAKTISLGGTATWESWDAITNEQSLSHPWGAVGLLGIQRYILGLKPLKPQFEEIEIKPLDFGEKLDYAKGMIPSDRGDVWIEWKRNGESFTLKITIPDNVKANVYIPKTASGSENVSVNGKKTKVEPIDNFLYIGELGSGTHQIEI